MTARPIIAGRLYHVHGCGIDVDVVAAHGCDAIIQCATLATLRKARP